MPDGTIASRQGVAKALHRRGLGEQEFRTSIIRGGVVRLEPPRLDLDVDAIYAGSGR